MAHKCRYFNGQAPVGEVAGSDGRLGVDDAGLLPGLDVPQSDTVVRGTYEVKIHHCCGSGIRYFFDPWIWGEKKKSGFDKNTADNFSESFETV
jgi:hypothetical protein